MGMEGSRPSESDQGLTIGIRAAASSPVQRVYSWGFGKAEVWQ